MKKFKLAILSLLSTGLVLNTIPFAVSSTSQDVLTGANADLDYVYIEGENIDENVTSESENDDNKSFEAFGEEDNDSQYLYMGMDEKFTELYFNIDDPINYESEDDEDDEDEEDDEDDEDNNDDDQITWEYNDGDDWRTLSIDEDTVDNFKRSGTHKITFDAPSAWEKSSYNEKSEYWVRASLEEETEEGVEIEQISALVYNVSVTVTTDRGQTLTNLSKSNFGISNPVDNKIYAFDQEDSNTYVLALQTETTNNDYTVMISVDGYMQIGVQAEDVNTEMQELSVELSQTIGCIDPFVDTDFHWSQTAVNNLYCRGIVDGENNTFMVNHTVTRAEFLKMALMNADVNVNKYATFDVPFADVSENDWEYKYIATAYQLDVIDGDSYYFPEGDITRVEALTILVRLAGIETDQTSTRFADVDNSDWYATTVRSATDYNVVEGYPDGTFRPENILTRGESAVMVDNAFNAWYQEK